MGEKVKIISEELVKKTLDVNDVITCVENTWRWYGEEKVVMPSKITLDMSQLGVPGWMNSMPSYVEAAGYAGMKWVGGFSENPKNGRPFIRAKVFLANPRTGDLVAIVGGDHISDLRTGAQPAIAAELLAAKTDVVTIIGAGMQAYTSLLCMSKRLKMKEVRVCDLRPEARKRFKELFADQPFSVVEYESNEEACKGSDIIITVTTADAELVQEPWVKRGALVMTMGSFTETSDDVVLKADRLITDHIGQTLHRGNICSLAHRGLVTESSFSATLPDILAGKVKGRTSPDERIVVELVGMGAPDATVAAMLMKKLEESGMELPTAQL